MFKTKKAQDESLNKGIYNAIHQYMNMHNVVATCLETKIFESLESEDVTEFKKLEDNTKAQYETAVDILAKDETLKMLVDKVYTDITALTSKHNIEQETLGLFFLFKIMERDINVIINSTVEEFVETAIQSSSTKAH